MKIAKSSEIRAYGVPVVLLFLVTALLAFSAFGSVVSWDISPDGQWRVEIADFDRPGVAEIYSSLIPGGVRRKLNPTLPANRGVLDFLISPTSDRVFYRADIDADSRFELYSVPIGGGASTKVNATLTFDYDVEGYHATSDGLTVIYRSGRTDSNNWKLSRARADGTGQVVQVSETVTGASPVDNYFCITPDDLSVVYLLTNPARELYSTPIATPHSTRINQPLVTGGRVYDGFSVDGCGHVRYRADAVVRGRIQWWLGRVGGGVVMAEIFSNGFESGNQGGWR